ncbi:hypothetical protein CGLO_10003 [Colletotrichum gloeosporioides Cg-14]|uniref:Uncharacterized protein n=1 Tax=Colletotrichum gloeosporioides (strain Cg-14) TaxID=1237896 RepID=T0K518_COLGC|nr:hypothetical protein CGLO_10003 [Colletotrichum gloeosporioides Cg-14]
MTICSGIKHCQQDTFNGKIGI